MSGQQSGKHSTGRCDPAPEEKVGRHQRVVVTVEWTRFFSRPEETFDLDEQTLLN